MLIVLGCAIRTSAPAPVRGAEAPLSASGEAAMPDAWWTAFDDPGLTAAVDQALAGNLTVAAAVARVDAARAVVRRSRAALIPEATVFASSSVGTGDRFDGVQRVPVELGARVSYELDLWGRVRGQLVAEAHRREATVADLHAARLVVAAEVARTWVALGAVREELALLDAQIVANEGRAAVVEARFLNGVVRQADALRQQRLLEQTLAARVLRLEAMEVLEHQLAVLLGEAPQAATGVGPDALPSLPSLPDAGVPATLLRRRPDVRAAEHAVHAADAEVAAAIADLYPRVSLGVSASDAPSSAADLLSGWVVSLGLDLVAPIVSGGRRRAEVRRSRAALDEAVAAYGQAVLGALQEVEDALARNRRQAELVDNLARQVDLAQRTADGLQAQYTGGLGVGYLDVLTAQTTAQQLVREQIGARERHLLVRIALCQALAGGVP